MEHASLLKHIQGKLWIDKEDLQWAKAEANVVDPINIGLILARIGPGTHIQVDQIRVTDNFWMPSRIRIEGAVKVLLVHTKKIEESLAYSDYRREDGYFGVADSVKRPSNTPPPTYPRIRPDASIQDAARQPVAFQLASITSSETPTVDQLFSLSDHSTEHANFSRGATSGIEHAHFVIGQAHGGDAG